MKQNVVASADPTKPDNLLLTNFLSATPALFCAYLDVFEPELMLMFLGSKDLNAFFCFSI